MHEVVGAHVDPGDGERPADLGAVPERRRDEGRHGLVGGDPAGPVGLVQHRAGEPHAGPQQRRAVRVEPLVPNVVRGERVRDRGDLRRVAVVDPAGDRQQRGAGLGLELTPQRQGLRGEAQVAG